MATFPASLPTLNGGSTVAASLSELGSNLPQNLASQLTLTITNMLVITNTLVMTNMLAMTHPLEASGNHSDQCGA